MNSSIRVWAGYSMARGHTGTQHILMWFLYPTNPSFIEFMLKIELSECIFQHKMKAMF